MNKEGLNELALFAGAGGGILGGKLLGWRTVCAVEFDPHARNVLIARQNDGCLEPFPVWDDVRTFDGKPWRGIVDVVSGGFPCQDISTAGKGAGIDGKQSSMWVEMARVIGEIRPRFCLVENSPALTFRGLGRVLGDLAGMGYNAEWGVLGASDTGAPHRRKRIWIVAHTDEGRWRKSSDVEICIRRVSDSFINSRMDGKWPSAPKIFESRMDRMVDGVAFGVDRHERIGNGQVPAVVRLAWELLSGHRP